MDNLTVEHPGCRSGNTREGMTSSGPVLCLCLVNPPEYTMVLSLPLIHCGVVKLTLARLNAWII